MIYDVKEIYEDDSILVIDKPSGLVVNRAKSTARFKVLQDLLEKKDYPLAKNSNLRSGIVHRLDKETSGVLIIAKNEKAFNGLQLQFKTRKVKKKYLALVHGKIHLEKQEIDVPVGRLPWNRTRFGVIPGGRKAKTTLKLKDYYFQNGEDYSLLEVSPHTGRTHQIRIHLKHLGYPVVSDLFYAGRKKAKKDRLWCPRLFLHASELGIIHPQTGKRKTFKAKLPSDLTSAINSLEKKA